MQQVCDEVTLSTCATCQFMHTLSSDAGLFGCGWRGYSREAVEVVRAKQAVCIT